MWRIIVDIGKMLQTNIIMGDIYQDARHCTKPYVNLEAHCSMTENFIPEMGKAIL